jgi:hypothetical protein|tara:strand:+ start:385 stop:615 length:231 start_codon:yes stop_codon:yes gene_type:complete
MPNVRFNSDLLDVVKKFNSSENKTFAIEDNLLKISFDIKVAKRECTESIEAIKNYIIQSENEVRLLKQFLIDIGVT